MVRIIHDSDSSASNQVALPDGFSVDDIAQLLYRVWEFENGEVQDSV